MRKYLMVPLLVLVMVLTMTACSNPVGMFEDDVEYSLMTVNGGELPYAVNVSPTQEITSGTLTFRSNGTYTRVLVLTSHFPSGSRTDRLVVDGVYSQRGTNQMGRVTFDGESVARRVHILLVHDGHTPLGRPQTYRYRRNDNA